MTGDNQKWLLNRKKEISSRIYNFCYRHPNVTISDIVVRTE